MKNIIAVNSGRNTNASLRAMDAAVCCAFEARYFAGFFYYFYDDKDNRPFS